MGGSRVLTLLVVAGTLVWTGGALADPDVWWHVATGRLVLDSHAIPHTDPWSFTAPGHRWVPTAWLSDVLFAGVWRLGGYDAIRLLRVLMAAAVVVAVWLVARSTARRASDAALATALTVLALAPFLRERPQVLSLLFVAWLAVGLQRILAGAKPSLVVWVPVCWLWANLHGMWVLLPVSLLGAGVLAWWEDRTRIPLAARCTLVALLSWLVVLLTPVGPRLAYWPLVVQHSAAPISEWQPTVLTTGVGAPYLLLLGVLAARWARAGERVPTTRLLYVLAVSLFGLLAFRNVAPAAILLLPELARAPEQGSERDHIERFPVWLVATVAIAALLAGVRALTTPTVGGGEPVRLVKALASEGRDVRFLNHYDIGGYVTGTASPPLHVAIDGRTDMWSASFVRTYVDALNGTGDWRTVVDDLRPDAALLPKDAEITRGLVRERHWHVVGAEGRWVLLEPAP